MKDAVKGKIMSESVGLKSKMYSFIVENSEEIKKAKAVNKNVVKSTIHKEFVDVLFNKILVRHKMKTIQSTLCLIGTYDVCKIFYLVLIIY